MLILQKFKYRQNLPFLMRRQREHKSKKFMVYFIGIIMVFSVFGVMFFGFGGRGANTITDKGLDFVSQGNYWVTTVDNKEAIFSYLPSQVESINVDNIMINKLQNVVEIDVTSDFNDTFAEEIALAQFQMSVTLMNFGVFVRNGYTSEQQNFPVMTCGDSSSFVPVIYFKKSNGTNVFFEDNCIIAEASNDFDILRIKDRLVYGVLGIIE